MIAVDKNFLAGDVAAYKVVVEFVVEFVVDFVDVHVVVFVVVDDVVFVVVDDVALDYVFLSLRSDSQEFVVNFFVLVVLNVPMVVVGVDTATKITAVGTLYGIFRWV